MSVIFRGNGTTTSSIFTLDWTFKDTIPNTGIFADVPNAVRVVGDGGFDYVYRRGKPRAAYNLQWAMFPKAELSNLQRVWKLVENHHWFTVQTTDLSEKSLLYNLTAGTVNNFQGSLDGINPMPGENQNWIISGKWAVWTTGLYAGKPTRIMDFHNDGGQGKFQTEEALNLSSGERFYIGYPSRFIGPLRVNQIGNINTHYGVEVDCEVVIF